MKLTYKHTKIASYLGYVTQAIVNNYAPLLFVTFSNRFSLSLEDLSILITINFAVQMLIDLTSTKFVKPVGLRKCCVLAHVFAAVGLVMYGVLPFILPPYAGIIIANIFCAIGGGLDEVVISPVIEAIPGDSKASDMSLLHSFYCWGQVLVVAGSTLFFVTGGIDVWPYVSMVWAIIPAVDALMFAFVPLRELNEGGQDTPLRTLFSKKIFWIFMVIMVCAGASELSMSQWASLFAEQGLKVEKTVGDLLGPCCFAVLMGIGRTIFGIAGKKMNLRRFILGSGILCIISYMIAIFSPNPIIALCGCALCGLSVALMWPGTYSLASAMFPAGGTAMFSILALGGDIGCTGGPTLAGLIGDSAGDIRKGLLVAAIFPAVLVISLMLSDRKSLHNSKGTESPAQQ